jgi:hypothetical protein
MGRSQPYLELEELLAQCGGEYWRWPASVDRRLIAQLAGLNQPAKIRKNV